MADIQGIDLASYQGTPHPGWSAEAGAYDWAGVKLTELSSGGLYTNPDAKADWDYLKANGKGRIAYLFAHANTDATATVDAFKAALNSIGVEDSDGIAVDLEELDGLAAAAVASWARVVVDALQAAYGRPVILYCNVSTAQSGACDGLEGCYLWIADPSSPMGDPRVPGPWKDWVIQQWNTAAPMDRDVAHFSTLAAMQAAVGKPAYTTTVAVWTATGSESLEAIERLTGCEISTMLRLTAEAGGEFSGPMASYINAANFAKPMPKGTQLRYYRRVRV
jgi:hypothetical protein